MVRQAICVCQQRDESCLKNSISSKSAAGQLCEHTNEMDQNNSFPEQYPESMTEWYKGHTQDNWERESFAWRSTGCYFDKIFFFLEY